MEKEAKAGSCLSSDACPSGCKTMRLCLYQVPSPLFPAQWVQPYTGHAACFVCVTAEGQRAVWQAPCGRSPLRKSGIRIPGSIYPPPLEPTSFPCPVTFPTESVSSGRAQRTTPQGVLILTSLPNLLPGWAAPFPALPPWSATFTEALNKDVHKGLSDKPPASCSPPHQHSVD